MEVKINEEIRTVAYFLWKNAGEPNGEDMYFWEQATKSVKAPIFFVGKRVVVEYNGIGLQVDVETSTETECIGKIINKISHYDVGDEITFTPDEIREINNGNIHRISYVLEEKWTPLWNGNH